MPVLNKNSVCCKNCHYWDIDTARDKAGRVRSSWTAPCLYPMENIRLPSSWPFTRGNPKCGLSYVAAGFGDTCQTFLKRGSIPSEDRLQEAVDRIKDMLQGDDGQAWKEAEKFIAKLEAEK